MAISLEWAEEVLTFTSNQLNATNSLMKKVVNSQIKTADAAKLSASDPAFFRKLHELRFNLEKNAEIASSLAAAIDGALAGMEKEQ